MLEVVYPRALAMRLSLSPLGDDWVGMVMSKGRVRDFVLIAASVTRLKRGHPWRERRPSLVLSRRLDSAGRADLHAYFHQERA